MTTKYEDIIHLPHHVSANRPRMSISERAAQFSPFAALTGHGAAIKETARLTGERIELDDDIKDDLSHRMQIVADRIKDFLRELASAETKSLSVDLLFL